MAGVKENDRLRRLHSKVDQLSTLIGVLKQKEDRYQHELLQYKQKYEFSQDEVSRLQDLLAKANQDKALMEYRLHALEETHEKMIQKNDHYKEENSKLKKKQAQESAMTEQLQRELQQNKNGADGVEKKCKLLERRVREVESQADIERRAHKKKMEKLNASHSSEIERLKKNMHKMQVTVKKATEESENKSKQVVVLQRHVGRLNQYLTSNETKRQEYQSTIKSLETKLSSTKLELEHTKKSHKEELSRDSFVSKLKRELDESQQKLSTVEEEYLAFKTHSNDLLTQERQLNDKLRHLLD